MSEDLKKRLMQYGFTVAFVIALAWLHIWLNDNFSEMVATEKYRVICDAFTIPGLLLLMLGCLIALSNLGSFYGLGYVLSVGLAKLIPGRALKMPQKYYDYVQEKKSKKVSGFAFVPITGAISMVIALVFMYLFYNA